MLVTDYSLNDTITFSQSTIGAATVTLSTLEWSEVSGIREAFRILVDSNEGEAVLTEDPQFQSQTLNVEIIKPLSGTVFNDTEWILRVPRTKEVKDYLPKHVKSTLILPEYLDSLQDVSIDEVQDAIQRLRNLRRWNVMDKEFLDLFLQTMGMFFKSETFDVETKRRFVKETPAFIQLAGTKFFANYLGVILGALFVVTELWTNDYKSFILRSEIPVGFEDEYYPTNHVRLQFDSAVFGIIDPQIIIELFYFIASVPLVLDHVLQTFTSDTINVSATVSGFYEVYYIAQDVTP